MDDDLSFEMSRKNYSIATLEILVQIFARQDAMTQMFIEQFAKDDEDKKLIIKNFEDDYKAAKKNIMHRLFEDFGELDLKGFFDEDVKE